MTDRTRSRPSTVAAIVAPGAAALLSATTAFALHHSPAPKAAPVKTTPPGTRTDDAAVARLRQQSKTADAELERLRAQLAQVNSELAKAGSTPVAPPRGSTAGPQADVVPVAVERPAAPAPAPPVDASTGAS